MHLLILRLGFFPPPPHHQPNHKSGLTGGQGPKRPSFTCRLKEMACFDREGKRTRSTPEQMWLQLSLSLSLSLALSCGSAEVSGGLCCSRSHQMARTSHCSWLLLENRPGLLEETASLGCRGGFVQLCWGNSKKAGELG